MSTCRAATAGVLALTLLMASCGVVVSPRQRIEAARKDMASGDWRGASIQLNKALTSKAYKAQAWELLAEISLDTGDVRGGLADMREAVAAGAAGAAIDVLRVRIWLAAGRPQTVLDAIAQHAVHLGEPEQSFALARAYNALGQTGRALAILKSLLAQQPELAEAHILMGESLAAKGMLAPALQEAETAGRLDPKSTEAPLLTGQVLMAGGQFAAAERSLSRAVERMPPDEPVGPRAMALSALTDAQLRQGQLAAAVASQRVLAHWVPGAPITHLLDARIKIARGDVRDAVSELELLVGRAPHFVEARLLLGAELVAVGKPDQAQVQLAAVLARMPGNLEAEKLLTIAHLNANEPEAALNLLAPALTAQAPNPRLLALAGVAAVRLGGADRVLGLLASDDGVDPQNENVRLNLAQAYLSAARPDLSLEILRTLHAPGSLRKDRLLLAAVKGADGPRAADAEVQRLLAANPHSAGVLRVAAEYYTARRDFSTARRLLSESLKVDPANPATPFELASIDAAAGDLQAAQNILRGLLAQHPQALPVRIALARLLADTKAYPEALSVLRAAGQSVADQVALQYATASVYLAAGNLSRANDALDRAIASRPGDPAIAEQAVTILLAAKQYAAALDRVDAGLASRPADAGALALKGAAEEGLGNTAEALAAYELAQKLRPSRALALSLFELRLATHQVQPEQSLTQWLAIDPHDVFARQILAQYDLKTRRLKTAAREFSAVVNQAPDDLVALNNLAWIDDQIGDPQAQSLAERAYRLAPDSANVNDTLGWILAREGRITQALPRLAQAVKLSPADPDLEYHYAYVLSKGGQRLQAHVILTRLLSRPGSFDSRPDAERLLAATGGG